MLYSPFVRGGPVCPKFRLSESDPAAAAQISWLCMESCPTNFTFIFAGKTQHLTYMKIKLNLYYQNQLNLSKIVNTSKILYIVFTTQTCSCTDASYKLTNAIHANKTKFQNLNKRFRISSSTFFSSCIPPNTTRQILLRIHYTGDMLRLTL
jgi:hypothetical protein